MKLFRVTFLLCFMPLTAAVAYPCSCDFMKPKKKLKEARAVFVGEVVGIGHNDKDREANVAVRFKVERYWKGVKEPHITVVTAPGICCTCGLKVQVGVKYLIYAFPLENGQVETSLCDSAPAESERSIEELRVLGKGKVLKSAQSPSRPPPNNGMHPTPHHIASHAS
jgi:hypothetical protein